MKKIILHIGSPKTGTSAIQSCLAKNVELLNQFGIDYPEHHTFDLAKKGHITSGNLTMSRNMSSDWFKGQILEKASKSSFDTILFSCEHIFYNVYPVLQSIIQIKEEYHFELILFVRNPIDQLKSTFNQRVKRAGYHGTVQELKPAENRLGIAEEIVRKCNELDIKIKFRNYSICRKNLIHVVSNLIQPNGKLELIYDLPGKVNRSLSKFELELQLQLNEKLKGLGNPPISDYFVNELPDIQEANIIVDENTRQQIIAGQRESLEYINGHLPANEKLTFEEQSFTGHRSEKDYTISSEQITIVAKYMADNFVSFQTKIDKQNEKTNETILQIYGKRFFVFNPNKFKNSVMKRLRWVKHKQK